MLPLTWESRSPGTEGTEPGISKGDLLHLPLIQLRAQLPVLEVAPGTVGRAQRSPPPAPAKVGPAVLGREPLPGHPHLEVLQVAEVGFHSCTFFQRALQHVCPARAPKPFPSPPVSREQLLARGSRQCWLCAPLPCLVPAAANPQTIPCHGRALSSRIHPLQAVGAFLPPSLPPLTARFK